MVIVTQTLLAVFYHNKEIGKKKDKKPWLSIVRINPGKALSPVPKK